MNQRTRKNHFGAKIAERTAREAHLAKIDMPEIADETARDFSEDRWRSLQRCKGFEEEVRVKN